MTASAQGIDISSYQSIYPPSALARYDFAFFRATLGTTDTDANFPANWANGKTAKIHRGAYHELTDLSPVSTQAEHFISTVRAQGAEPGDMMAVVASDYPVTEAAVLEFASAVKAAFPQSPVCVYSDLSVLPGLAELADYPLWVAWYSDTAPESVAPWKTWTFWQWQGTTAPDNDAFNGTAAELQAWLDTYVTPPPAPPADWTYGPPRNVRATGGHTSVRLTWEAPAGAPQPPAEYQVFIYDVTGGKPCSRSTIVPSYPRTVTTTSFEGGSLTEGHSFTAHVVAAGENGTHVAPYVYGSVTFATG